MLSAVLVGRICINDPLPESRLHSSPCGSPQLPSLHSFPFGQSSLILQRKMQTVSRHFPSSPQSLSSMHSPGLQTFLTQFSPKAQSLSSLQGGIHFPFSQVPDLHCLSVLQTVSIELTILHFPFSHLMFSGQSLSALQFPSHLPLKHQG